MKRRGRIFTSTLAAALMTAATIGTAAAAADNDVKPRFKEYYKVFTHGQQCIPHVACNGAIEPKPRYTPQGLAYWKEKDWMVVSYYHGDEGQGNAILAILDRKSSRIIKEVTLKEKGHVASLATSKDSLWVSSTDHSEKDPKKKSKVYRYSKKKLDSPKAGADKKPLAADWNKHLKANSTMEIYRDKLYVADWKTKKSDKPQAYRYKLDGDEKPHFEKQFDAPRYTQGFTIHNGKFVWSTSAGINKTSKLYVQPAGKRKSDPIIAPNMSQDMATVDGKVYIVYESASYKYSKANYRVSTIHHERSPKLTK